MSQFEVSSNLQPKSSHGLVQSLLSLFSFGRPPEPRAEVLPRPIPLATRRALTAVGHRDTRSVVTAVSDSLAGLLSTIRSGGFQPGAIYQTIGAGSDAHILVHKRLYGTDPVVGWIVRGEAEQGKSTFEFRQPKNTEVDYSPKFDAVPCVTTDERRVGATFSSLESAIRRAEKFNFRVTGMSQIINAGYQGAVQLECGAGRDIQCGSITAVRNEDGTRAYLLTLEIDAKTGESNHP